MRKKTRARVHVPVTRRIKKQLRRHRDLEKNIQDPLLRENWDNRRSIRQNIGSLSLDKLAKKLPIDHIPSKIRLSEQDIGIVKRLIAHFGSDHEAMARDRKINYWQWTATQCENQIAIHNRMKQDSVDS